MFSVQLDNPTFWSNLLHTKKGMERIYYSDRGHGKRLSEFYTIMYYLSCLTSRPKLRVLDLGCGIGSFYRRTPSFFNTYIGFDFCKDSIKEAKTFKVLPDQRVEFYQEDILNIPAIYKRIKDIPFFDFVILSGILMFQAPFPTTESCISYIKELTTYKEFSTKLSFVTANFLWDRYIPKKGHVGLRQDSIDNLVTLAYRQNLYCSLRCGYLPHEFIVTFLRFNGPLFDKGVQWI